VNTARELLARLKELADPAGASFLQRFFKTGPGEYGAGDVFLGIRVPETRKIARQGRQTPLGEVAKLLASEYHEARLLALLILVERRAKASEAERRRFFDFYLAYHGRINNWDLVDLAAPHLVGSWMIDRERDVLDRLAKSKILWERRTAIVATHWFIRQGQFEDTLRIAAQLLEDKEDLIHKATGWMLREVGKRDGEKLEGFLASNYRRMPRTMLRYAIERLPEARRRAYLEGRA
jgi:3-methyladenine DNA glycosylase AlkD